jgi:magnesium transporter
MQNFNINPLHLEDIQNPEHPSIFLETDDYNILIYRLFDDNINKLDVYSNSFLIYNENIYEYNKEKNEFIKYDDFDKLYKTVDNLVDKSMKKLKENIYKIEELEEIIYDEKPSMKEWFNLKKEMIRMERVLNQAVITHQYFMKKNIKINEDNNLLTGFEDIKEHLNRAYRNCQTSLLKLDNIYNIYNTISNEKMNSTIYILTIISAIFLPLNLVVGFFGMNTTDMFLNEYKNGTLIVSSLLIMISIILIFSLRKKYFK